MFAETETERRLANAVRSRMCGALSARPHRKGGMTRIFALSIELKSFGLMQSLRLTEYYFINFDRVHQVLSILPSDGSRPGLDKIVYSLRKFSAAERTERRSLCKAPFV